MKLYVVYRDYGYEGYSAPLAVFDSQELANIFVAGCAAGYGPSMEIEELLLNQVETKK